MSTGICFLVIIDLIFEFEIPKVPKPFFLQANLVRYSLAAGSPLLLGSKLSWLGFGNVLRMPIPKLQVLVCRVEGRL